MSTCGLLTSISLYCAFLNWNISPRKPLSRHQKTITHDRLAFHLSLHVQSKLYYNPLFFNQKCSLDEWIDLTVQYQFYECAVTCVVDSVFVCVFVCVDWTVTRTFLWSHHVPHQPFALEMSLKSCASVCLLLTQKSVVFKKKLNKRDGYKGIKASVRCKQFG